MQKQSLSGRGSFPIATYGSHLTSAVTKAKRCAQSHINRFEMGPILLVNDIRMARHDTAPAASHGWMQEEEQVLIKLPANIPASPPLDAINSAPAMNAVFVQD